MKVGFAILIAAAILAGGCTSTKTTEPGEPQPIRITNPANNATLSDPVLVSAVPGTGYAFDRVDFFVDGDSVWTDSIMPYQYYWDIFIYSGTSQHTLTATGYTPDTSYTSADVNVNVVLLSGFHYYSIYVPNTQVAYGATNYQNALFVATGTNGLEVIDISSKGSPQYISRYDTQGQVLKADVLYPNVFIADYGGGVTRADFSNPDSLVPRGTYTTQAAANDVAVSNSFLFVAEIDGLSVVSRSNPNNLSFISKLPLTGQPQFVVARNDTAFVAALDNFYIINCTNPNSPGIVSQYVTDGQASGIAVTGDLAFVADGPSGVSLYSIADPANPTELSRFNTDDQMVSVDVGDSTLFASGLSGVVYALDYSQPDTLRQIDQFDTGNLMWQIHSDAPYLYVATSGGVLILRFLP